MCQAARGTGSGGTVAKALRISLHTGAIDVPTYVRGDDEDEAARSEATLTLVREVAAELDEIEGLSDPREQIKRIWVLNHYLGAHPKRWIKNFQQRHE